jgi:acetylornithine/LysW-gamma-L-lysine aminotransferase
MVEKIPTDFQAIKALEDRYGTKLFPKRDVALISGQGALLRGSDGKEYIDLGASYGVGNVGHCHPRVVEAIKAQSERLLYVSPTFYNDMRARLSERLAGVAPNGLDRVYLCNSGTEAVESAIKYARKHTGRPGIISCMRSFHGRTLGALSATFNKKYREGFEPLVPGFEFVPYGDLEAMKKAVTDKTAAVIVEPIQGEGGIFPAPEGYLKGVRDICTDAKTVFIADEIQTGLGRTGKMFAVEHWGVSPDIITVAKSLAAGLPLAAMITKEELCDLPTGSHGSTFGGSPICCAAALAVLDILVEEKLPERAASLGERAMGRLWAFAGSEKGSVVREVRGLGLMIGIELKKKAGSYLDAILGRGAIALPAGTTVIRLLPPLVISEAQLDRGLDIIEEVLTNG